MNLRRALALMPSALLLVLASLSGVLPAAAASPEGISVPIDHVPASTPVCSRYTVLTVATGSEFHSANQTKALETLAAKVNVALAQGAQLAGGVATAINPNGNEYQFSQAIVWCSTGPTDRPTITSP